jgi:hypothetical protein
VKFRFLKALFWEHGGRRWVAVSGPSLFLGAASVVAGWCGIDSRTAFYFLVRPLWWTWGLAVLMGVLIAAYLAWKEQYQLNKSLIEGGPRIVLAEDPIERSGFVFQTPLPAIPPSPERFCNLIYTALRVKVGNEPIVNTLDANTRVNARVGFYNRRNERVCVMDGRWADSPQPRDRDRSQDYVDHLSAPFPVGAFRSLDLMFIRPDETHCIAVNNDSFVYEKLEAPGRRLTGIITVVVDLNGTNVKSRITFNVNCETMTTVGSVGAEDLMPRLPCA